MTKKAHKLLSLYFSKEGSVSALDGLLEWIGLPENKKEFLEYVKINYAIDYTMKDFNTKDPKRKLLDYIENDKRTLRIKKRFKVLKYAAALLFLIGMTIVYKWNYSDDDQHQPNTPKTTEVVFDEVMIPSGSDKAVLTTEDGFNIVLGKGKKIQMANFHSNGEEILYDPSKNTTSEIVYNYLTIPRGGQFQVALADGTKVWLNSESQLKYPVAFTPNTTRKVELLYGEAYFDVSPSAEHNGTSFKVLNQLQEIEVLGTEFNLKAYKEDTNIYTTLVEGKVVVSHGKNKKILAPGQQASLDLKNSSFTTKKVDTDNETLWIKGIFSFKDMPLKDISNVMSRWYDVDIIFEKKELEDIQFNGLFRKEEPLEDILQSIVVTKTINAYEMKNEKIIIQ